MNNRRLVLAGAALAALALSSGAVFAQSGHSPAVAKDLVAALDHAKLDSIAARDPNNPGVYVAALYYPGAELLLVQAKYSSPAAMDGMLSSKSYRDAYIDLSSASDPATKIFVEDLKADGLESDPGDNQPFDSYEGGGTKVQFNHDWKSQKISEDEYKKAFATADEQYTKALSLLLAQLKNPS